MAAMDTPMKASEEAADQATNEEFVEDAEEYLIKNKGMGRLRFMLFIFFWR